jgi:hypothetical protein
MGQKWARMGQEQNPACEGFWETAIKRGPDAKGARQRAGQKLKGFSMETIIIPGVPVP